MPSLMAASATRQPIFPRPTTPNVWPASSKPAKFFLPFSTVLSRSGEAGSSFSTKRCAGAGAPDCLHAGGNLDRVHVGGANEYRVRIGDVLAGGVVRRRQALQAVLGN